MTVWRINLNPDAAPNIDPRGFCIEGNILGVGWPVEGGYAGMTREEYYNLGEAQYYDEGDRGWWPAINAILWRMEIGHLCWTRDTHGIYYLGRITGDWEYCCAQENLDADIVNLRSCEWVEVGGVDAVPGAVLNSFRARRTLQQVHNETVEIYSEYLYSELTGANDYELPNNADMNLFSLLFPEDCEDVVGIYLQLELKYTLIPSTCKMDTPITEFVLKNGEGNRAFVQVRQGDVQLDLDIYGEETLVGPNDMWYLFSTTNNYVGEPADHIVCLQMNEMNEFAYEHRTRMSGRVQNWMNALENMQL